MVTDENVSEEEMNSLTQSILIRYGIDFTCYEPQSLRRRIIRVLNRFNLSSIHELWLVFLTKPDFIQDFMNEISVGMTSMFRDPVLWKNLKNRIANDFGGNEQISVWHAGCSSGEEVYSLAILLSELNLLNKTDALATDFNQVAMAEAQLGIYHKIKMIENEKNYREINLQGNFRKYYSEAGLHHTMNPGLIKNTTFKYHNLVANKFPEGFDIIFCRNVMIYFDNVAKKKVLEKFYSALNPGGIFILGLFDTVSLIIDNEKFLLVDDEARIFKKR